MGVVAYPTGSDQKGWNKSWNARRCDSGRAMVINGRRGYWTKGVMNKQGAPSYAEEGAYFPRDSSSFAPPYEEWPGNPIYKPDGSAPGAWVSKNGYENCEFFM